MTDPPVLASATTPQPLSRGRFAVACILAFGIPLLFSAPAVALLWHDTEMRRGANEVLTAQIGKVDAQIVDLKDLNKVKSQLLARKQIVEALQAYAGQAAAALDVFGHLPEGTQVLTLQADAEVAAFDLRSSPAAELGVLELLAQHGFGNLRITARHPEKDGAFERVTIEARARRRGEQ
jgi:Tfp pilus assembly protein PilN